MVFALRRDQHNHRVCLRSKLSVMGYFLESSFHANNDPVSERFVVCIHLIQFQLFFCFPHHMRKFSMLPEREKDSPLPDLPEVLFSHLYSSVLRCCCPRLSPSLDELLATIHTVFVSFSPTYYMLLSTTSPLGDIIIHNFATHRTKAYRHI